jgi:hypothetical protein
MNDATRSSATKISESNKAAPVVPSQAKLEKPNDNEILSPCLNAGMLSCKRRVRYHNSYAQLGVGAVDRRLRTDSYQCFDSAQSIYLLVADGDIQDVSICQEKIGGVAF